jgi:plasmid stabilization system protein ParE
VTYRVLVTPIADAGAMESFRWYTERSTTIAERWYAGLNKAIASLAKNPGRFPISEEDSAALACEARILLYGRRRGIFRILYTVSGDTVWVLRIRHSAQGPIDQKK